MPKLAAGRPALRKKPEDTSDGCRQFERADRVRAGEMANDHMRSSHMRSADAWGARASMLERLEASSRARTEASLGDSGTPAHVEHRE